MQEVVVLATLYIFYASPFPPISTLSKNISPVKIFTRAYILLRRVSLNKNSLNKISSQAEKDVVQTFDDLFGVLEETAARDSTQEEKIIFNKDSDDESDMEGAISQPQDAEKQDTSKPVEEEKKEVEKKEEDNKKEDDKKEDNKKENDKKKGEIEPEKENE